MKRVISSLLALVIALSLVPFGASATPNPNPTARFTSFTSITQYDATTGCGIPGGMSSQGACVNTGRADPYPSEIIVSGVTGTVLSAKITLNYVNHSNLNGLRATVATPDYPFGLGLLNYPGSGEYTGTGSAIDSDINFETDSTTPMPESGEIPIGPYEMASSAATAMLQGDPNGTWGLYLEDFIDNGGINGTISFGWRIEFTMAAADTTAPVVTVPDSMTVEATDANGTIVTYDAATALDDVDGVLTPDCTVASGTLFPLGDTVVYCSATDAALNSASTKFSVTVADRIAPVVTKPTMTTMPGAALNGMVPVNLSWSGSDAVGMTGYHLQGMAPEGTWGTGYVPGTATSKVFRFPANFTFRIRVRAVDAAGNLGAWKTSTWLTTRVIEADDQAVTYSTGWKTGAIFNSIDGMTRKATRQDATATVEFQGTSISWVSARNSMRGMAEVSIDGVYIETVDLYRPLTNSVPTIVFNHSGLNPDESHSLTIKVLGQGNADSTGTAVVIDHFIVGNTGGLIN